MQILTIIPADHYWIVGTDTAHVFSSARNASVPTNDPTYLAWLQMGYAPLPMDTQANLTAYLRAQNVPPYHSVSTGTIVSRLEAAGLGPALQTAVGNNATAWRRMWSSKSFNADDAQLRTFLTNLGANLSTILAPE